MTGFEADEKCAVLGGQRTLPLKKHWTVEGEQFGCLGSDNLFVWCTGRLSANARCKAVGITCLIR